ncbi:MAG: hypothetical protein BWY85_02285 [Firmicutes bacterium ADurb.Bin506]|nr:MAG: hypothetical protein BWY85_02285 [Firmicutes bacterium ADurb.Bin506]
MLRRIMSKLDHMRTSAAVFMRSFLGVALLK